MNPATHSDWCRRTMRVRIDTLSACEAATIGAALRTRSGSDTTAAAPPWVSLRRDAKH